LAWFEIELPSLHIKLMEAGMATRRGFMRVLGGGVIFAALGASLWAATRDPVRAKEAWVLAGQEADSVRRALSFAVLAPNPHNRQPWLADLRVPDQITLFCELDRRLDYIDPFDRQTTIGLGAFLEILVMALAEEGIAADLTLFPDGQPQPRLDGSPVARLRLRADPAVLRDPLFAQVTMRRTDRLPYDVTRPVPAESLDIIASAARGSRVMTEADPARVAVLRDLAWSALLTELNTPATLNETLDLMRIGKTEIIANPDGIAIEGPLVEFLALTGLVSVAAMRDPTSQGFAQQITYQKPQFETAMALIWIVTPGNSRPDQIQAGRDYVRVNLAATALGVALQPWSQALQEFPEMSASYRDLRDRLDIGGTEGLQMFARAGYADPVKPSPRWPMESRLLA
jgi:hypothetical protein